VGALRSAFKGVDGVQIGRVEYATLPRLIDSPHELFFHKRQEFSTENEIRTVRVFRERLPHAVSAQILSGSKMNALLENLIAALGMRDTMCDSLRTLVVGLFRGVGIDYEPNRFRRSA
jgi:hypothetical protein